MWRARNGRPERASIYPLATWEWITRFKKIKLFKLVFEVKLLSRVGLFATPWTVARQAPPSMVFSRQKYWSGLPFPSPGIFPTQGLNPGLPHCRQMLYCLSHREMSAIVWEFEHSLALPFFGIWVKTDLFQSCGHCWLFQICWHIKSTSFTASSFRIWNSSTGIPSPPLALFVVWSPTWLHIPGCLALGEWSHHRDYTGHEDLFLYSFVYSCHLFLVSSASVRSIPFLSFFETIFAWSAPLVSLIFLKRSLVFPILLFSSISLHWPPRKAFLSLLGILSNSAFRCLYLSFSPLLFASLLFTAICKASPDSHFAFLHFFSVGMGLISYDQWLIQQKQNNCRNANSPSHEAAATLTVLRAAWQPVYLRLVEKIKQEKRLPPSCSPADLGCRLHSFPEGLESSSEEGGRSFEILNGF